MLQRVLRTSLTLLALAFALGPGSAHAQGLQETSSVGGQGGQEFRQTIPAGSRLTAIQVNCGRLVDGFRLNYETPDGKTGHVSFGNEGGDWQPAYLVPRGVQLVGISGRYGRMLDSVRFHFSDGSQTPAYGRGGSELTYKLMVPTLHGKHIGSVVGFYGRSARVVDNIGVVFVTP